MLWIFPTGKIRRLRSGANPRSWVPEASMLTTRTPKPLLRWGTGVFRNFSTNCACTKSVYPLPPRKTFSTRKQVPQFKTPLSKTELHTLPVLHFNRCLTTEYSETTAHFSTATSIMTTKSTYRCLSAQRLSERTVQSGIRMNTSAWLYVHVYEYVTHLQFIFVNFRELF
jgi:hypothetical protein